LEENRDQLYAEAYHALKNKVKLPEVPMAKAQEIQEAHLPDDAWTDLVADEVRKSYEYCRGSEDYCTTIKDVYSAVFGADKLERLGRGQEMRIAHIFKKELGLVKSRKMVDGEKKIRWQINPVKLLELQTKSATQYKVNINF